MGFQILYTGAEQSGTPAEIGGVTPEISSTEAQQPLLPAQVGTWRLLQMGLPANANRWDCLCTTLGLQDHRQLPVQPSHRAQSAPVKLLF